MASNFERSTQLLDGDSMRTTRRWTLLLITLVLAWLLWFFGATIPIEVRSDRARIESTASHAVQAPMPGQISTVRIRLGQGVRAGDVIFDIDTAKERLAREGERLRTEARRAALEQLQRKIDVIERSSGPSHAAAGAAGRELHERIAEAEERRRIADEQLRRAQQLHQAGLISEAEWRRIESEAVQRRAAVRGLTQTLARSSSEEELADSTRSAELEQLKADVAVAQSELNTALLALQRTDNVIAQSRVRAPVSGRIAALASLNPGAVVATGQLLASIVPESGLAVVAAFAPAAAVGRIRDGQMAHVRLEGFSPIEYGTIAARVTAVATEPQEGLVRVEMEIIRSPRRIPLQHGIPAVAEIGIERVTPATLFFRAVGKRLNS